jgi:HAD superfamily hydrolase (TIGR01549 family)
MKYKNIIFDFDGVLAESVHIKTQAFYKLYEPFGVNVAEKVVQHHKANGGMSRFEKFPYYHKILLNKDLSLNEIENFSTKFSKLVLNGVIDCDEVTGAEWFLEKYKKKKKWIVSATPTNEIIEIVKKRQLSRYFIDIYGSPAKKSKIVKKIISEYSLNQKDTVFLGDAIADFEAARLNGIDFLLRKTSDNIELFNNIDDKNHFIDYYELDKRLNN